MKHRKTLEIQVTDQKYEKKKKKKSQTLMIELQLKIKIYPLEGEKNLIVISAFMENIIRIEN